MAIYAAVLFSLSMIFPFLFLPMSLAVMQITSAFRCSERISCSKLGSDV